MQGSALDSQTNTSLILSLVSIYYIYNIVTHYQVVSTQYCNCLLMRARPAQPVIPYSGDNKHVQLQSARGRRKFVKFLLLSLPFSMNYFQRSKISQLFADKCWVQSIEKTATNSSYLKTRHVWQSPLQSPRNLRRTPRVPTISRVNTRTTSLPPCHFEGCKLQIPHSRW